MKTLLKKLQMKPNQSSESQSREFKKPLSGVTNWINSVVTNKRNKSPQIQGFDSSVSSSQLDAAMDELRIWDSGSGNSKDPELEEEEEYQIQLALELSAIEDPEAVQIEAAKQISLGSCHPDNTPPAEILSYRYWVSCLLISVFAS